MSLYIGKLSPRTRRDDLERVFGRFGQCDVRIKDGFGFVVYDYPPNAEKALRAFQGRTICGELLTISWSKKQPRAFHRFEKGNRSYEARRGRNFAGRGDYGQWGYKRNMNQLNNDGGRVTCADKLQENDEYNRKQHQDFRESLPDEDGSVEHVPVDYGRWGDQGHGMPNDQEFEHEVEIERVEQYRGYERKNEYGNSSVAGRSSGSPQEKIKKVQIGERTQGRSIDPNSKVRCYNCGAIGHKKLSCPRGVALDRKFTRFDRLKNSEIKKGGRGEGNLEKYESKSGEEMQIGKYTSMTHHRKNKEVYGSSYNEIPRKSGSSQRKEYKGKKRIGNDIRTSKEHSSKRTRRSVSSPLQSDYTASRSLSNSQLSKSQRRNSHSRSRSTSYRARSLSSVSRLSSKSHCSRSRSPKSRSKCNLHTSLSASVGLSLPSPPNEMQFTLQGSLNNATTRTGKISVKPGQHEEDDLGSHGANVTTVSVNDEKALSSLNMEDDIGKEQPLQLMSGSPFEMPNPCTPHLDKCVLPNASLSSSSFEETKELPVPGVLVKEDMLTPFDKPDSEAPFNSCACNITSISAEELNKVLKHYGLPLPEQNERHLSTEDYFGSSRLWPWEIIYYRRLKKGPILNENYVRRLAQNKEFGIVDKYIRSSSGWGELSQDSNV